MLTRYWVQRLRMQERPFLPEIMHDQLQVVKRADLDPLLARVVEALEHSKSIYNITDDDCTKCAEAQRLLAELKEVQG